MVKKMKVEVVDGKKVLLRILKTKGATSTSRQMVHQKQVFKCIQWAHGEVGHSDKALTTHLKVSERYFSISEEEVKCLCATCPQCSKALTKKENHKGAVRPIESGGKLIRNRK